MEKPTLFWAVIRDPYSSVFKVMRVTSYNSRMLYGSIINGDDKMPLNCRTDKLRGKFGTKEAAEAVIAGADKLYKEHTPFVKQKESEYNEAYRLRDKAVEDYLKAGGISGGY